MSTIWQFLMIALCLGKYKKREVKPRSSK